MKRSRNPSGSRHTYMRLSLMIAAAETISIEEPVLAKRLTG